MVLVQLANNMLLIEASEEDLSDPCWAFVAKESNKSPLKFKIGAAIVDKKGRILVVGHNTTKSHPVYGSKYPFMTMHSEGNCLYNAKKLGIDVAGKTMIIYRRGGLNSKPCKDCQVLLKKNKIKYVIYTI